MKKKTPAQKKADAEFINKIKTVGVITKTTKKSELSKLAKKWDVPEQIKCEGCGDTLNLVAASERIVEVPKHDDSGEMTVTE